MGESKVNSQRSTGRGFYSASMRSKQHLATTDLTIDDSQLTLQLAICFPMDEGELFELLQQARCVRVRMWHRLVREGEKTSAGGVRVSGCRVLFTRPRSIVEQKGPRGSPAPSARCCHGRGEVENDRVRWREGVPGRGTPTTYH